MNIKEEVVSLIDKEVKLDKSEIRSLVEVPPNPDFGDYAFPCFKLGGHPVDEAARLISNIKKSKVIDRIDQKGQYVNFFVDKQMLAEIVIKQVFKEKKNYGVGKKKKDKIMVEYYQANTHKAFHVGHIRGTSLGESLSRILKHNGYEVIQANYQGDTGAHVAKWLWAYLKYHKGQKPPKTDQEKWIASIYVEAVKKINEKNQNEVDEINLKLENNTDPDLTKLWKESRQWSLDSLDLVYEDLRAHFDRFFFEREMEPRAREIVKELLKKGLAEVSDGATIINLEKYDLGVWVLLRKDGTCLYSAKDIALAEKKFKEFKIDRSIYVMGAAQSMHFKQLFKTLELMNFSQAEKCYHLSYAEVRLPSGKMSSRTGENILYSDLKEEMTKKLRKEVEKRHSKWSKKKKEESVGNIFSSAIKFDMLMQDPNKNIVFDIDKALDFEGETGPYVQYAHARACSILRKAKQRLDSRVNYETFNLEEEIKLIKKLGNFEMIVEKAGESFRPHLIARYLIDLSQSFNEFYHKCPVISDMRHVMRARLLLVECVRSVIENGLNLLGISAPEEM